MRTTKRLKAARAAFRERVICFIRAIGAVEHGGMYQYTLQTPIGELAISLWDSAIMCRFDDVARATEFTSRHTSQLCNRYSGKWNWHFNDDAETLNAHPERTFVRYLTMLMSLGTLPCDLSQMTHEQTTQVVQDLSRLPLRELRRRQDIAAKQIKAAHQQRNDSALTNLRVREEHLRLAIERKVFADSPSSV